MADKNEVKPAVQNEAEPHKDLEQLATKLAGEPGSDIARTEVRGEVPREREATFGGPRLKLSVPQTIPGFHLVFENDVEGRIEQLLDEGFTFVMKSEVGLGRHEDKVVSDDDVTSRVSRNVGRVDDTGNAVRAFLMKIPEKQWKERERAYLAQADAWEESIRVEQRDPSPGRYMPGNVRPILNTRYRKEY